MWAGLIAITVLVAHLPSFFHRLLDGDEAIYGSIAALLNTGGVLYGSGGVDNKPPGVFFVYAATYQVAGTYQMTAIHAVGLLVIAATCVVLFMIGRELGGVRTGLMAALFYGVLTAAGNPRLLATNTELLMMLPLTASVLLMLRRRWMWAGGLLVAAGAFRQVAAVNVVLAVAGILWLEPAGSSRWRAVAWFAGGIAAALVAGALVLLLSGSLPGFWRWTVSSLYGYASTNWIPQFVWMRARDSLLPFVIYGAVFWIGSIGVAIRWRRLETRDRLVVVWLAVAMAGSVAAGHLSWHYFIQVMGPLAVAAARFFDTFTVRRLAVAAAAVGIALPAFGWWVFDTRSDPLTYDSRPPVPQHQAVATYMHDHTSPDQRVFVWGNWPALYIESDRLMASRFPGFLRGFARGSGIPPNNWDTTADVWPLLQADLSAHPPALIVDTATAGWSDFAMYPMSNYPGLADLVANRYHVVATVDGVVMYAPNSP